MINRILFHDLKCAIYGNPCSIYIYSEELSEFLFENLRGMSSGDGASPFKKSRRSKGKYPIIDLDVIFALLEPISDENSWKYSELIQ